VAGTIGVVSMAAHVLPAVTIAQAVGPVALARQVPGNRPAPLRHGLARRPAFDAGGGQKSPFTRPAAT
jgi:hypothetical protein